MQPLQYDGIISSWYNFGSEDFGTGSVVTYFGDEFLDFEFELSDIIFPDNNSSAWKITEGDYVTFKEGPRRFKPETIGMGGIRWERGGSLDRRAIKVTRSSNAVPDLYQYMRDVIKKKKPA